VNQQASPGGTVAFAPRPAADMALCEASTNPPGSESRAASHVLACIAGQAADLEVIRRGRTLADHLGARITVLHAFALGNQQQRRRWLKRDRTFAHALKAPLVEVPAYSPLDGIVEYAQSRHVTHLVLSAVMDSRWHAAKRDDLVAQLAGRLRGVDLYVVRQANQLSTTEP